MKIEVPTNVTDEALGRAVLAAIGKAGEERIVSAAVKWLTESPRSSYGTSPLMEIVHTEARFIAQTVLREKLNNDPAFIAALTTMYEKAIVKFFNVETQDKLVDKLATKMAEAIAQDRY